MALRLRGTKTELEDAGLETEGMADTVSQLQAKLKALTHGKVDIMIDANNFKNTTQVLREMASAWKDMTDVERSAALELMGGKRQANILASIIKNFDTVEQVITTSQNSAGSALKENEVYLDSIQGKLDQLSNSTQTMWMNFMRSDVVKFLISVATEIVKITDKVGLLNVAFAALMAKATFTSKNGFGRWSQTLFPSLDKYIVDAQAAAAANKTLGLGATVAAGGVKLLNAVLTTGVTLLAGIVVNAVIKGFYELAHASEQVAEAAKKAQDNIETILSEFKSNQKTVSDLAKRFAELSQGVDSISGKNISLRTDDYEEFLDISNQLADIFPTLSRHYDENGNAIVQLSGDTNTIVGSLENLLEVQRQLANQQIADNIPDLYKGIKQESDQHKEDLETLKAKRDAYQQELDLIKDINGESFNELIDGNILRVTGDDPEVLQEMADQYLAILEKLGLKTAQLTSNYNNGQIVDLNYQIIGFDDMSDEEFAQAKQKIQIGVSELAQTYFDEISNLNIQIQNTENKNKANWSSLLSSIFSWLQTDSSYRILSDDMKSVVQTVINNTDFSDLNFKSWEELQGYIQNSILPIFTDPNLSKNISGAITEMFDVQTKFNSNEISLQGYNDQVLSFIDTIRNSDLDEAVQDQLLQMFNIDVDKLKNGEESLSKSVDTTLNYLQNILNDEAKKRVLELNASDLQIINNSAFTVPDGTLLSWDGLQAKIQETRRALTQDFTTADFADYVESINKISTNISTYQEALDKLESGTFTLSDFMGLIKQFPDLAEGVDVTSKSFDGLSANLRRAIKNSPKSLITDLKKLRAELDAAGRSTTNIDQLINAIENMPADSVENLVNEFGTLADKINAARVAQDNLQKAMQKNPNEGYETRGDAIEQMKKLMEQGQIGSGSELWDIAKAYGFTYNSADTIQANADALYEYIQIRERWFKKDKEGNYTDEGITNFIKDVASKKDILEQYGATWTFENGELNIDFDNESWDKFAEALGLTSEEFADMMQQVAMFFEINWSDADDVTSWITKLSKGSETAEEKLAKITKTTEDYVDQVLGEDLDLSKLSLEDLDEIKMPEGMETEEFEKVINLLKKYIELRDQLSDPLNLNKTLEKKGVEGLSEIPELQDTIKKNSDGTTVVDEDAFKTVLEDAGYTEEAIDSLIKKIKEYQELVGQSPTGDSPAGAGTTPNGGNATNGNTPTIEETGKTDTGSNNGVAAALIAGGATIGATILSKVMDGAGDVADTATDMVSDIVDTATDAIGDALDGDNKVKLDIPDDGVPLDIPSDGIPVNVPGDGIKLDIPEDGIPLSVPENGIPLDIPENGLELNTPDDGIELDVPDGGIPLDIPSDGVELDAPENGMPLDVPDDGLPIDVPEDGIELKTPENGIPLDVPTDGVPLNIPENGIPLDIPEDGLKVHIDNGSNEPNDTDDNPNFGERISTSIQDTAGSIVDSGVGIVEDAGRIVSDVAGTAEDTVNWVADQVHSLLNLNPDREGGGGITRGGGAASNSGDGFGGGESAGGGGGRDISQTSEVTIAVNDEQLTTLEDRLKKIDRFQFKTKDIPVSTSGIDGVKSDLEDLKTWLKEFQSDLTVDVNLKGSNTGGGDEADGTAHAKGTAHARGTAFKTGSWGASRTETALVGELGPEILVRGDRWATVGENGAEFTDIRRGDIIFNHKQTRSLLENGYVTGRGKAFAEGNAFVSGSGSITKYKFSDTSGSSAEKLSKAADDLSSAADNLSEDFEEIFDWIEVRIEEITETISLLGAQLENAIGSINQNAIIDDQINMNKQLYDNLIAGANEYYKFAAELLKKVPKEYRAAAQNGQIAIEYFKGKVGQQALEAIQNYREWVQKGADATQQAEETLTEISNLAKQAIDNIASDYENKKLFPTIKMDQYEAYNSLLETGVGAESAEVYREIIKENNKNIATLQEQRNKMQAELNKQVEAGNIKKYSQNWYDAINDIAAVDTEIIDLTTDTENYQDAINELHWDHFDNLISRLEAISNEADNLIDILSAKDLVDKDTAEWTDEGITSLGLYAQKLEVAEMQADKYAKEIRYLNDNWKALGYTEQEYVEKLEDLKSGQYDAIKAYNQTKDAIVDLNKERVDAIKEGIQKEIDAYSKLIEKKKEELNSEKDLYDFQKNIADQQKNITDIQRKLIALSSDNSASARAERARLQAELAEAQADLEDTYYDRSVTKQQEALDKELEDFQDAKDDEMEALDKYLENTEQVVADSLATIQANTDAVYQTLTEMGQEYSLSITEALTSPWQDGEAAIQSYSEKFGLSMSSTVEELQKVAAEYKKVMDQIEEYGDRVIDKVNKNVETYQGAEEKVEPNVAPTSTQQTKAIKVGSKVNAGKAQIYSYAGAPTGKKQYYSKDPVYKVLAVKGNWVQVRYHKNKKGVTGWFRKGDVRALASGTTKLDKSGIVNIDELGEELILGAKNGRLSYLEKGSSVIPADITSNLISWGELDPQSMLDRSRPVINAPHITNNNIEIDMDIAEVVHIDRVDNNNLPDLTKAVEKQMDKYMKNINSQIRKYTR